MQAVDECQRDVGLGPSAEEDRLEDLGRVREAQERARPGTGARLRADEVDGMRRTEHQRPLAVVEPDGAL